MGNEEELTTKEREMEEYKAFKTYKAMKKRQVEKGKLECTYRERLGTRVYS